MRGCVTLEIVINDYFNSESDLMPVRASPSGFAVPYHFLISNACGFAFGYVSMTSM